MSKTRRSIARLVALLLVGPLLASCGGDDAPVESADAFVFLSPSDVSVAPGQTIELQVDIANLPANDAVLGYAISLSEETTRIRIESANCAAGTGTVSCRLWTIRPDADAPPGDYAFSVRASGTFTPVSEADARFRVVPIAQAKRAVVAASAQHVVTADGRLWARGENAYGQTGVGFESVGFDVNAPFVLPDFIDAFVQVGTDTDWVAVVSARASVIALKADGTVWGWGSNPPLRIGGIFTYTDKTPYQFGLPSERDIQLRPRQIPGLANIKAISALAPSFSGDPPRRRLFWRCRTPASFMVSVGVRTRATTCRETARCNFLPPMNRWSCRAL